MSSSPGTIAQPASKRLWKRDGRTVGRGDEYPIARVQAGNNYPNFRKTCYHLP